MIFDSHLHLRFTTRDTSWEPVTNTLIHDMERAGITHTCIMGSSNFAGELYFNEDDMRFQAETLCAIKEKYPEQLFPLLHINPKLPFEFLQNIVEEYIVRGPIIGVKFSITMFADDEALDPFYDLLEKHNIPMLFHSWYKTVQRYPYESTPQQIAHAAAKHPKLRILMAHVTGCKLRGIQDIKRYPNIWIDTSGSQPEDGYIQKAIDELGAERVLYGSDYPIRAFSTSLARIDSIDLTEVARYQVLYENARQFYRKGHEV